MAKKSIWRRLKYKNIAAMLAVLLLFILVINYNVSKPDKDDGKSKTSASSSKDNKKPSESGNKKDDKKDNTDSKKPSVNLSTEALYDDYKYITLSNEDNMYTGDLILINGDYAYNGEKPEDMVSSYDYMYNGDDVKIMSIRDSTVTAKKSVLEHLNDMLSEFYSEKGIKNMMVVSGYRTVEYQQELYDNDLEKTGLAYSTFVAKPNHSEHHSGYALDFQLDAENYPYFSGEGEYKWILENCHKYGFVRRYDDEKADITGISGETWHFRYVGIPHAQLMYNSNLCLEEYILSIKGYTRKEPLYVDVPETGERFAIYYVAAEEDSTNVPVPVYEDGSDYHCTISGNNCDGYIVTVNITAGKVKADQ